MIHDILETKLQQRLQLVIGQTLFRTHIPADVSIAVMTRLPLNGVKFDEYKPGRFRGEMQVVTRHSDPTQGDALALSVQRALRLEHREEYPATALRGRVVMDRFYPVTLPVTFPRLDGGGYEWSQNFRFVFCRADLAR